MLPDGIGGATMSPDTYCSNLLLSGGDLKDAKEMIGHSDIAMTDRYTHIIDERKAYRQEKLAEHYSG